MSPAVEKLIERAKKLTPEERQELATSLRDLTLGEAASTLRDQVNEALIRDGLMTHPARRAMSQAEYSKRKPIAVRGKPVSETIIEERR